MQIQHMWVLFLIVGSAEVSVYKRFAWNLRVKKTQFKPRHAKVNADVSLYLPGQLFTNL